MGKKMFCSECGMEMNQHAEKVDYTRMVEGAIADPIFGGAVIEAHTCPRCGKTAVREETQG